MFKAAGHAEIIRSHQKDEYYINFLKSHIADISQVLFGPRHWIKWRKELSLLADFGYFGLTTLGGFQTIGEEYVNIVQVDRSLRAIPSKFRRLCMVLVHVLTPYVLHKFIDWFEKWLKSPIRRDNLNTESREFLLNCIPAVRHTVTFLHRCHLALFYFQGVFYHIAKRLTSVNYVKYSLNKQRSTSSDILSQSFRFLGWLSWLQLLGSFAVQGYKVYRNRDNIVKTFKRQNFDDNSESCEESSHPALKCSLCLENRKHTTSTPCGHLYCWNCIHEWCQNKPECPLCRQKLQPQSLIFLQNYDPPG